MELKLVLPVLLAEAPEDKEAVGVALNVLLALNVEEGVAAAVPVPDTVPLDVGNPVLVWVAVPLPEKEIEAVLLADAPDVSDAVCDADTVVDALNVDEGVVAAVPVPDPVGEPVALAVGV